VADLETIKYCDLIRAYKAVAESADGALVLADIASAAGLDDECFDLSPRVTAYRLGQRSIALHIKRQIAAELPATENDEQDERQDRSFV